MALNSIDNFLEIEKAVNIYLPTEILLNLMLAFILGMFVSFLYKVTHKGLSYSQSLNEMAILSKLLSTKIPLCVLEDVPPKLALLYL